MRGNRVPGPYELMWLSDRGCPVFEDIGLGIGCLKVKGNPQFAVALCPAARVLAKEYDPIRSWWQPHGFSSVEPAIALDVDLRLAGRSWRPHEIQSSYELRISGQAQSESPATAGGSTADHSATSPGEAAAAARRRIEAVQRTSVFPYGASARLDFQAALPFALDGSSDGPCKIWRIPDGLHIVESGVRMRPFEYEIRFEPAPDVVVITNAGRCALSFQDVRVEDARTQWRFGWSTPIDRLAVSVSVVCDAGGRRVSVGPFDTGENGKYGPKAARKSWDRYYHRELPRLVTPDADLNELTAYFGYVYRSNIVNLGGILPHPFSMPKETFVGFWMWDCCFHAMSARWHADRDSVWGNLLNIENLQYPQEDRAAGCVNNSAQPYGLAMFISEDPMSRRRPAMPHVIPDEHGDGSHPPVFAQALEALWSVDGNDRLLRRLLPNARAYHDWFERTRSSETIPGLLVARRWSDSGMDNSKRWGHQGSGIYGTGLAEAWWSMPIVTVDLNVLSIVEKRCLGRMYASLGDEVAAKEMEEQAAARERLVHQCFWDDERGFYFDCDEKYGKHVPVWSPTGFFPMLLDGLSQSREARLLHHMFDPTRFWANMPFPSLSMDDPDYRPSHSYWMGCTWMSYTIYILRALFRRQPESGWRVLDRIARGMMRSGSPQVFENYNPATAEGQDCPNFGWHGMISDVVISEMLGVGPAGDTLAVSECRCPTHWDRWSVENLSYRGNSYTISAKRSGKRWEVGVERTGVAGR